jgi:AcrR family transcriptional regulator
MFIHLNERPFRIEIGGAMGRVTQEHIDARRQAILDATAELFVLKGVRAVTMQEIADRAGVSAGAIYRYYPSKDDLTREFFRHCIVEGPVQLISEAMPPTESAREQLHNAARMLRAIWEEQGFHVIIGDMETMLAATRDPQLAELQRNGRREVFDLMESIVRRGQDLGEFDPALNARAVGMTLYITAIGVGMLAMDASEAEVDGMFEVLDEMLERFAPGRA